MADNNEEDDRPLVSDLLEKHASKLDKLRTILEKEPDYSKERYDDLWMLRFLLSHKNSATKAGAAAIKTMKFRRERKMNEMGDVRHRMYDHTDPRSDRYFETSKKYFSAFKGSDAMMFSQPDRDRGLVQFLFMEEIDSDKIMEEVTYEEVLEVQSRNNEVVHQVLDEVTRRTGRLTKCLKIIDLTKFSLQSVNRRFLKREAAARKELEDFYPQMLGTVLYVNPPAWAHAVWKLLRPFFPKRYLEKLAIITPTKDPGDVGHFLRYVTIDDLPARYGGKNEEWPPPPPSHLWN